MGAPCVAGLAAYASWCDAVEGNTTFYAAPSPATIAAWARQAPDHLRFTFKMPATVTHRRRLRGPEALAAATDFVESLEPLGDRARTVWLQLPASFGPDELGALHRLLPRLPRSHRYTVEVRHRAFFDDARAAGALERVLATVDAEWMPFDTTALFSTPPTTDAERDAWEKKPRMPRRATSLTTRPIVRYLGRDDPSATVAGWQPWLPVIVDWLHEGRSPTVFVHTPGNDDALVLARRLHDEVRAMVPDLQPLPEPLAVTPATLF